MVRELRQYAAASRPIPVQLSSLTNKGLSCAAVMFTVPTDAGLIWSQVVSIRNQAITRNLRLYFSWTMPPSPHRRSLADSPRSRGIPLRHTHQSERDSPVEHCPSAYATCRSHRQGNHVSPYARHLQLSGMILVIKKRRVLAKVEWHSGRAGSSPSSFIVTNPVAFYQAGRGVR